MEDERIEAVRNWPEPKSVQDIQVFIGFANFYQRFIHGFSRIAAPLTPMLKMTGLSDLTQGGLGTNEVIGGGGKTDDRNPIKKSKNAKARIQTHIGVTGESTFLTPSAKEVFN